MVLVCRYEVVQAIPQICLKGHEMAIEALAKLSKDVDESIKLLAIKEFAEVLLPAFTDYISSRVQGQIAHKE